MDGDGVATAVVHAGLETVTMMVAKSIRVKASQVIFNQVLS
jgi:hypothetical protein